MRILHVIPGIDPREGGPATGLLGAATAQARAGLDVRVIACWSGDAPPQGMVDRFHAGGVEVELVGPTRGALGRHPGLCAAVAAGVDHCDVVHIHALWAEIQHVAAVAARRARRPYVFTPHGMLDPWSLRQGWLKKKLYMMWRQRRDLDGSAALHFTTTMERDLTGALQLRPASIVEPNGIDWSEFESLPPRGALRNRYPQIGDRPLVAFLGRVHPGKGVEYLIPALTRVADKNVMLAVIGPDSEGFLRQMQRLAREYGVAERVIFTGMLSGRARVGALVDADLFGLPSEHENFGMAVVEALACGLPVVISDQVAVYREIVDAGVGSAVPLKVDRLARELTRWVEDGGMRAAVASRAREFVRERFLWTSLAQRWRQHYERIMSPETR